MPGGGPAAAVAAAYAAWLRRRLRPPARTTVTTSRMSATTSTGIATSTSARPSRPISSGSTTRRWVPSGASDRTVYVPGSSASNVHTVRVISTPRRN